MDTDKKFILGTVIATLLLFAGIIYFGASNTPEVIPAAQVEKAELVRDHSQVLGNRKSKVTVIEFGDFQCPACASVHPMLKQLTQEYGDKIAFVFRHFPLSSIHSNADLAARAAEAAGEQGKFWEMHDLLFERQGGWSGALKARDRFVEYAQELGLDTDKFDTDLTSSSIEDHIALDKGDGQALGVNSTPTILINGQVTHARTLEALKAEIDALLK